MNSYALSGGRSSLERNEIAKLSANPKNFKNLRKVFAASRIIYTERAVWRRHSGDRAL
jgi:hypothetical protein